MNYKAFSLIFLLSTSTTTIHSFQIWNLFTPFITFFIGTFQYVQGVTDYFVPATHAELVQTKREIASMIVNNTQEMEHATLRNIDHIFKTTNDELENKIDTNVNTISLRLNDLIKYFETVKEESCQQINQNYAVFIRSAKTTIQAHAQKNKDTITTFLGDITSYNKNFFQENMTKRCLAIQEELKNIKKNNKNSRKYIRALIKTTAEENSEIVQKHHAIITNEIDDESKKLHCAQEIYKEKIELLHLKCKHIKELHNQKIEEFLKRVTAITLRYKKIKVNA